MRGIDPATNQTRLSNHQPHEERKLWIEEASPREHWLALSSRHRICRALRPSWRTSHGTLCFCDRPRRRARHAVARHVIWRGIGPGAGHVLAGTRPVRHATGLSEAFRELHTNRLLDGRGGEAMRDGSRTAVAAYGWQIRSRNAKNRKLSPLTDG